MKQYADNLVQFVFHSTGEKNYATAGSTCLYFEEITGCISHLYSKECDV